jgi:hypothetical protein
MAMQSEGQVKVVMKLKISPYRKMGNLQNA